MSDIFRDYSFGGWLRSFRVRRNMTLRLAADKLFMNPGNLSKLERSELDPPRSGARVDFIAEQLNLGRAEIEILKSTAFQHHLGKLRREFDQGLETKEAKKL